MRQPVLYRAVLSARQLLVRHSALAVFIFVGIFFLAVFWPLLFDGKFLFNSDLLMDSYARWAWTKQELSAGRAPLWASNFLHGYPMYLDQFGLFHPLALLFISFLPWLLAFNGILIFYFAFGAVSTYLFGRALGFSRGAAVFTTLAYVFAGQQLFWGQEISWTADIALFPLFFWLVLKLRSGSRSWIAATALATAHAWLGAYAELVIQAFLLALVWAFFHDWRDGIRRARLRTSRRFLVGAALGTLLVSPWLLVAARFIALTTRATGAVDHGGAQYLGLLNILQAIFPTVDIPIINPFYSVLWADKSVWLFMGIWPLVLGFMALRRRWQEPVVRFFAILALFAFAVSLSFLPLYNILRSLPVFELFRGAWKWCMALTLFLAVLGGFGFDYIIRSRALEARFWRRAGFVGVIGILLFAAVASIFYFFPGSARQAAAGFFYAYLFDAGRHLKPLYFYNETIALMVKRLAEQFYILRPGVFASLLPLLAIAFYGLALRSRLGARGVKALVLGTLALSLFLASRHFFLFESISWWDKQPPAAAYLSAKDGLKRYYSIGFDVGDLPDSWSPDYRRTFYAARRELIFQNENLYWGLDSIGNKNGLITARARRLLTAVIERSRGSERQTAGPLRVPVPNLQPIMPQLRMMGVGYAVAPLSLNGLKEVASFESSLGFPVKIHEVPDALPRAYLAAAVREVPPREEDAWNAVWAEDDFGQRTILECQGCSGGTATPDRRDELTLEKTTPGLAVIRTQTSGSRWVVWNEAGLPNWRATIDGAPATIVQANYLYQAVSVPAGSHEVVFRSLGVWEQFTVALAEIFRGQLLPAR